MSKIYSRPRIKFFKIFKIKNKNNIKENKKIKKILKFLIVFIIAIITAKTILNSILPIFNTICKQKAKSLATLISNEETSNVMKEHVYDEFFSIEKDKQEKILMIKSNIININNIISEIPIRIQKQINKKGKDNVEIALGSFLGSKLLSGRGPKVKIIISTIGNIETNVKSEFKAKGVNQTLHRVYLELKCDISILTPFETIDETINNQVLLMENIIIGDVPETYYNIEGMDVQKDGIELVN